MFVTKRNGDIEIFDLKKVNRSIMSAFQTVYSKTEHQVTRSDVGSIASGACADVMKATKYQEEDICTTVMIASAVVGRLLAFDTKAATAYILFSAAKHWAKETGYVVPPKRMLEIYYNRKADKTNE